MARKIDIKSYQSSVGAEVSRLAFVVRLSGVAAGDVQLNTAKSSTGATLSGYYDTLEAGTNTYIYYVDVVQYAKEHCVVFSDGGTNESQQAKITVSQPAPTHVSTEPHRPFSDCFPAGADIDIERWNYGGATTPNITGGDLYLEPPLNAVDKGWVTSRQIEGGLLFEFRDLVVSAAQANRGFQALIFYASSRDPENAMLADNESVGGWNTALANRNKGWLGLGWGLHPLNSTPTAIGDATTTVRWRTSGGGAYGSSSAIVLPSAGVYTARHRYGIFFDGHEARLYIDGTLMATSLLNIPPTECDLAQISVQAWSTASAGGPANTFRCARIDGRTDAPLVVDSVKPLDVQASGGGALATEATLATVGTAQTDGTQKAVVRGGAKGTTTAADVTSSADGANNQRLDVETKTKDGDITAVRAPGAGAAAESVADGLVHDLGTIQANKSYGLMIVPAVDGEFVCGHYRTDGTDATTSECPITAAHGEHPIIVESAAEVKIIRDGTHTNNFTAYLYPLNGGTIT